MIDHLVVSMWDLEKEEKKYEWLWWPWVNLVSWGPVRSWKDFCYWRLEYQVGEDLEGHYWLTSCLPQQQRPEEEIWREETWISRVLGWELWCASIKWWNGLGWAGYWTCLDSCVCIWPYALRTGQERDIPPTLGQVLTELIYIDIVKT